MGYYVDSTGDKMAKYMNKPVDKYFEGFHIENGNIIFESTEEPLVLRITKYNIRELILCIANYKRLPESSLVWISEKRGKLIDEFEKSWRDDNSTRETPEIEALRKHRKVEIIDGYSVYLSTREHDSMFIFELLGTRNVHCHVSSLNMNLHELAVDICKYLGGFLC